MKQLIPALFVVGAIMTLAGAAVFITGWAYAPYIYTVGAGFIALAQVNTPIKGKSKTLKRLRIQQISPEHSCSQHVVTNGLLVLQLPPYSNFIQLSASRRKKRKKKPTKKSFAHFTLILS